MKNLKKIKFSIIKAKNSKYCIQINSKLAKSPKGNLIELPNIKLAKIVLDNYKLKLETKNINIVSPIKLTNTAIDKIKFEKVNYINEMVSYLNSDVVCYFSAAPDDLVERQKQLWLPIVHFMMKFYDINLIYTSDISALNQNESSLMKLKTILKEKNIFELSALYALSQLTKSIMISLALVNNKISVKKAFESSNLEELYQISKWGKDEEAFNRLNAIKIDIKNIKKYYDSV
jgi:chaperone required for assembly of F1-ATPase